MTLIGLIGYAGSGKTSIAKAIGYRRMAFADVLKQKAASALGIGVDELEARKAEFRPLLVELGKAGRRIDPMRWVTPVMERVAVAFDNVVIDDARYLNECETIEAWGGHVFYIHRDGVGPANDEERDSILDVSHHMSLHVIHNSTTPEAAAAEILGIVKGTVKV